MTQPQDDEKKGWPLLHSQLPKAAFKPIPKDVYGVEGLTDVNEGHLIQRLHLSGLAWSERILSSEYLGSEVRRTRGTNPYDYTVYLAHVDLELTIDGRTFVGSGAHDNRKIDAAFKGAKTVAFKSACKAAGMINELLVGGRSIDFFYTDRNGEVLPDQASEREEATAGAATEGSDDTSAAGAPAKSIGPESAAATDGEGSPPPQASRSAAAESPAAPPPAPDDSEAREELYAISQKLGRDRASIDGLLAIYPVEKVLAKARKELAEKEDRDPQLLGELTTGHAANA